MRDIEEIRDEAGWNNDSMLELVMEWIGTYCREDELAKFLEERLKEEKEATE